MSNIHYASFMLRLQWVQNDDCSMWVASMHSAQTGKRIWFPNIEALIQFLQEEFGNREQTKEALSIRLPEIDAQPLESLDTDRQPMNNRQRSNQ